MRRIRLAAIGAAVFLAASGPAPAQAPVTTCLHGPSEMAQERARRVQALALAHAINRAESGSRGLGRQAGEYVTLDRLVNLPATPAGFVIQLDTSGTAYTFSIKDMRDPCQYALFSDQSGEVYGGTPAASEAGLRLLSRN